MFPEGCRPPFDTSSYLSPLMETNVMVLPPGLVTKEDSNLSTAGFVEVLEFLSTGAGFQLCGVKMVQLSPLTAGALHAICCDSNAKTQVSAAWLQPSLPVVVNATSRNGALGAHPSFIPSKAGITAKCALEEFGYFERTVKIFWVINFTHLLCQLGPPFYVICFYCHCVPSNVQFRVHIIRSMHAHVQVEDLLGGPSVVVVVQRDNAIACCHMIIKR